MIFIIPPSQTARHRISDHKAVPSEKEVLVAIVARGHWGIFCGNSGDETLVTNEIDFNDGNEDILRAKSTKKNLESHESLPASRELHQLLISAQICSLPKLPQGE